MKLTIVTLVMGLFLHLASYAQEGIQQYHFKKGEVLDLLLITTHPDSEGLFETYKKTAFPVAFQYGYQPVPGYKIKTLTLGNHFPNSFIFGKWENLSKREGFLENITKKVPDFHKQRRGLFEYFGLTYYEMDQDTEFSIQKSKYNVVTSFWQKDASSLTDFMDTWKKQAKKAGARILIQLHNGTSPLGYHYDPDILIIAQWENEESFHTFAEKHPLSFYEPLQNIHQFVLE